MTPYKKHLFVNNREIHPMFVKAIENTHPADVLKVTFTEAQDPKDQLDQVKVFAMTMPLGQYKYAVLLGLDTLSIAEQQQLAKLMRAASNSVNFVAQTFGEADALAQELVDVFDVSIGKLHVLASQKDASWSNRITSPGISSGMIRANSITANTLASTPAKSNLTEKFDAIVHMMDKLVAKGIERDSVTYIRLLQALEREALKIASAK